jgi:hypothetical protein
MSATELSSSPFVSVSSHLLIVFCTDCKYTGVIKKIYRALRRQQFVNRPPVS